MSVTSNKTNKEPIELLHSESQEKFETSDLKTKKMRYLSIDIFRGLAIVGMIFVDIIGPFDNVPAWSKHASDYGLTYVDVIAPIFIFAIGLTYKMSFNRTIEREGYLKTFVRFARRYGALAGFGFIGSIHLVTSEGIKFTWGVLQAIGYAGLFTMFFIFLPRTVRLLIGVGILVGYQFILNIPIEVESVMMTLGDLNLLDEHGGIIGGIGFAAMLLITTAIIDLFGEKKKLPILISGAAFTSVGIIVHFIWKVYGYPIHGGISKERITPSYVALTIGISALLFYLIWYLFDKRDITKGKSIILQPIGRNALFLYIIHPIFILLATLYLPQSTHGALVMFIAAVNVVIIWLLAVWMNRKKIYIVI